MARLEEKIAWITGAGSGIGEAAARALADEGATVVLTGRRALSLDRVAKAVRADGGAAETAPADVADAAAVGAIAADIVARHGRVDILVNSAGLNATNRHWTDITPEAWDQVVAVNLNGAFYAIHAVLPAMRAQRDGLVVNVASWAGRFDTLLTGPAYNASKHAMVAMNAQLNLEEGKNGIRACVICPGEVNTPILDKRPIPVPDAEKARMLQPEDLGATIRFVATADPRVCLNEILISPTWNRLNMSQPKG
jgi:NADP-dependent 3-hydroxy acid dehydrogenase YdfG